MSETTNATKLINEASKWVGYLEKKSNSQLSDFTANAGDKNYTIFAVDYCNYFKENINAYQAQPWCAMFVSVMFAKTFGKDMAEKLLGGHYAYCPSGVEHFKKMNRWKASSPKAGDVIFFKNSVRACHTGIVYKVDSKKVYTIEGNTSSASGVVANGGCVAKKSYSLTYSKIMGYGNVDYSKAEPSTPTPVPAPSPTIKTEIPMPTAVEAIYQLNLRGVINSPDLWYNGTFQQIHVRDLIRKLGKDTDVGKAIWDLHLSGIISETQKWYDGKWEKEDVYWLIRKYCKYLLERGM